MATNDTYNFYDNSRLVRIDSVENFNEFINLNRNQESQDDVCEADPIIDVSKPMPEKLEGEKAQKILNELVRMGVLDSKFQPIDLSGCQKGYLARTIASKLDISNVWVTFGELWNMKPSTLKARYYESLLHKNTMDFEEKIHHIFNER